jgi:DNA-binding NarL/FixJ family response regulator
MNKIRVLLAEDHTIVRKGLRSLLDGETGIEVIGEAGDGREAVEKVQQLLHDVVVMDITMPALSGLEATRQIKKRFPEVKVLILTMHATEEYVFQILRAGASG